MRHWMRKRIISILLILVMILPYAVIASGTTSTDDLNGAKDKKSSLEKQIEDTKSELAKLAKDTTDIQSYIKAIDKKMEDTESMIENLNTQIVDKKAQIVENQQLLEQAKIDSAEQYSSMKLRIQYMYEHTSESYLEVMLASSDMGDLLNKAEYINKITDYDREMLVRYAETEKTIQNTQVALQNDQTALEDSMASVEVQKQALDLTQDSKNVELKKLLDKTAQANSSVSQLESDKKAQEAEIKAMEAEIKRREDEAKANGTPQTNYDNGKFAWPVPASHRITSQYGEMEDRLSAHNGVDIGASKPKVDGDQIVAAYDGVVTIATKSSSAGNWIWINHGSGIYTVYMHNSKMLVSEGQKVTKGQVIALMGNTGNSTGTHLHFGVRVNGVFVNPRLYLSY